MDTVFDCRGWFGSNYLLLVVYFGEWDTSGGGRLGLEAIDTVKTLTFEPKAT